MGDSKNGQRLDTGDIALVLAIARHGSLSSAARDLGLGHATVFRKARAIEARFGTQLFYRDPTGITLTAAGAAIAQVATRLESEIAEVEDRFRDQDVAAAGEIRVATVDTLVCSPFLPLLRAFQQSRPDITLDVLVDIAMADIARREVDAAIRAGGEPPEDLVGRRLCTIAVAAYRSRESDPVEPAAMMEQPWVVPNERLAHLASARWLRARGAYGRAALSADSLLALTQSVAAGFGLGMLPCYVADADPRLVRVAGPVPDLASGLWFLTRNELRKVAKVRALSEFLDARMSSLRPLFEGARPSA